MRKLEIYEPPLCCPTGVCGPAPDPALAKLQENILRWKKEGIDVERLAINQALYDYDVGIGPEGGVGGFDMMDANRWDHNCFSKWMLDWLTPSVVSGGRQDLTLDDTATTTDCVLIWPGVTTGDIFSEFFMAQNRQAVANDDAFDGWFNADGFSVWHIDAHLDGSGN